MEEGAGQPEEGKTGKRKRKKKKKKARSAGEDEDNDLDEPVIYQEPPKLEVIRTTYSKTLKIVDHLHAGIFSSQDDEEFPGLSPALKVTERFSGTVSTAKQCNEVHSLFFFFLKMFSIHFSLQGYTISPSESIENLFPRKTKEKVIVLLTRRRKN